MSLYKQLIIIITTFLIISSVVILFYVMNYNKHLIINQLHANAKNSASFLGLSISQNVDITDTATIDGMISSIMDNGFYKSIKVYDIEEKEIAGVSNSVEDKVPTWFSDFVSFDSISATSNIMKDWSNLGHIEVAIDPIYTKQELYKAFNRIAQIFLFSTLLLLGILYFAINRLLRPLKKLSIQAKAIDKNEFIIEEHLPKTTEFKNVSIAMNKTISKLKDIVDKEVLVLKKYNKLLYSDSEQSNLGNRKYMLLKLDLYSRNSFGVMAFFEIKNRMELKQKLPYNEYMEFLDFIINTVNKEFEYNSKIVMAKMNEDTFSFLLPNFYVDEIITNIENIYNNIEKFIENKKIEDNFRLNHAIGLSSFSKKETISEILIATNKALEEAFTKEELRVSYLLEDKYLTKSHWEDILSRIIENEDVFFVNQIVVNINDSSMKMREYYTRLRDKDKTVYYPKEFLFGSDNKKLKQELEKTILKNIFSMAKDIKEKQSVVVNLSEYFISQKQCVDWLIKELNTKFKKSVCTFYFECSNIEVFNHQKEYEYFSKQLHKTKHKLAIESFAFENDDFEYLKVLKPAYLKIAKSYFISDEGNISKDILENITLAIGSELIIKHIETKDEYEKLKDLGVYLMQGHYIDTLENT